MPGSRNTERGSRAGPETVAGSDQESESSASPVVTTEPRPSWAASLWVGVRIRPGEENWGQIQRRASDASLGRGTGQDQARPRTCGWAWLSRAHGQAVAVGSWRSTLL